ncbi:MAG: hypothetical protein KA714_28080 [Limnoraphis sp. WC205]|jgi:hypothetical protein|nr:hypothetical protein [Limnoraphis sp. WC205]
MSSSLDDVLETILYRYYQSFTAKIFIEETSQEDDLMLIFNVTYEMKSQNRQYWGRELGMCWQRIVTEICRQNCINFSPAVRDGKDELCDLIVGLDAIDTKYRIGSGDAGTLKKFRDYATRLQQLNYQPVLLILRTDNLPAAITACTRGGWNIYSGSNAYQYLQQVTQFDLQSWLQSRKGRFTLS